MTEAEEAFNKAGIDTSYFSAILDTSDPSFEEAFDKAIGADKDTTLAVAIPQFDRVDCKVITLIPAEPEDYVALSTKSPEHLDELGCQVWDTTDSGDTHWLFPHEWYKSIPEGTEVIGLSGRTFKFEKGVTCSDKRFGSLPYGFIVKKLANENAENAENAASVSAALAEDE